MAGRDLNVAQPHAGIEHGGDEGVPKYVGVHLRQLMPASSARWCSRRSRRAGPSDRPAGPQNRPLLTASTARSIACRTGRRRCKDALAALAAGSHRPVPVLLAQVLDVRAAGLEDAEA